MIYAKELTRGGIYVNPTVPNPDPYNKGKYFQVFDQLIEVLSTGQMLSIEVAYNPITGSHIPAEFDPETGGLIIYGNNC
jgi:hypothetical protein